MKKAIKTISVVITLILCAGVFFACKPASGNPVDPTKSQLAVYNYDGGVGTEWLEKAVEIFEKKYEDTHFEPGVYVNGVEKKGVQISIYRGKALPIPSASSYNVFFLEHVAYNDLISQKEVLDITDIVTENLSGVTGGAESGTIANKLSAGQKQAITAIDGKYYVLPHYAVFNGVTYDKDLFHKKEFYFAKAGGWTDNNGLKSVGPDGIADTYDDGLPSSYEEFYALMQRMRQLSVTPFIWTGQYADFYTNTLLLGLWAAYCGEKEFMLNVNFGTGESQGVQTEIITDFTANNLFGDSALKGKIPVSSKTTITPGDGYLTQQQAGLYYAMTMLETIMATSANYSSKITGVLSHMDAQEEFIRGALEGNPIGMLMEGNWWYNEASDAFKRSVNVYKEDAENRNFAWMPLPWKITGTVAEGHGRKNTLSDTLSSFAFINANIGNNANIAKLAKLFLQFCYTDEQLADFTLTNGVLKGVNYTIGGDKLDGMDNFCRSVYDTAKASDIAYPYSANQIFINAQSAFEMSFVSPYFKSTVSGTPYNYPYTAFQKGANSEAYFKGTWKTKQAWDTLYQQYY